MATIIRAQISWQVDSMLPRDVATISPHFSHGLGLIEGAPEWQTLCDDLSAAVQAYSVSGTSRQMTVKLYEEKDVVPGVPNRPKATKITNPGVFLASAGPGEVAICLSYYGGTNAAHQRGRLYVPYFYIAAGAPGPARPSSADRTRVGGLVTRFTGLGGVNVDWGTWSPSKKQFTKATNWFVDDEWDIQRRRGLKPTTRTQGTTGE